MPGVGLGASPRRLAVLSARGPAVLPFVLSVSKHALAPTNAQGGALADAAPQRRFESYW